MTLLFEGDTINEAGLVCREGIDYSLDAVQMRDIKWFGFCNCMDSLMTIS